MTYTVLYADKKVEEEGLRMNEGQVERPEHVLEVREVVWCRRLAAQCACGACPGVGLIPLSVCQGYGYAHPCEHYRYEANAPDPHRCNFGDLRRSDLWQDQQQ